VRRTRALFGIGGALLLAAALVFRPDARADVPRVPKEGAEVLERLPRGDAAERRRSELRAALRSRPDDLRTAVWLARLDIEASRKRSDPRYLGQAQAALGPWWDSPSPPEPVLVLRATIRQSLHDFDGALADLDRVVAEAPDDAQGWITRSVVLSVRGRYPEARASCDPLRRLAHPLVFVVCDASVDGLTGHAADAYARVDGPLPGAPAELRSWAVSTLAELAARLGRADQAGALFRQTLADDPDDPYALAAYADLLLDEKRPVEVLALLASRTDNDNLLLRVVLAGQATGDPDATRKAELLAARYDASRLRGDTVHRREESRFALGVRRDAQRALDLARADWEVQREPWDVRVLLEAALAARDPDAARAALAFIDETRLEDPRVRALAAELRSLR
jgi:tetratricopeptide (TPR) repeat protein